MRRLVAVLACLALSAPAFAEEVKQETVENKQQDRMKACNERAAGKKGEERKRFMSRCLRGEDETPAAGNSQRNKMKECNEKAAGKIGAERKKFMSECLKG